ncbi:MAG: CDP-alcohol phosphatidyltransferase family protein, partial [Lapillicoccus sp.]
MHSVQRGPVIGVGALVMALVVLQASVGLGPAAWVIAVTCAVGAGVLLGRAMQHHGTTRLGPADWVTLSRAVLGQVVTALVVESFAGREHRGLIVTLTVVALALDAVDGRVARATGTMSALGARFDMEVDAFLILVLSVATVPILGWWVLLIGAARYALMVSEVIWPWLKSAVPQRYWRKVVAAIQG